MLVKKAFIYLALFSLFATLLSAAGCGNTVYGSGENATWEMVFADFNRIEVNEAFDVTVKRADSYRVSITVDKKLYEYLKIDQRGDTLRIGLESGNTYLDMKREAVIELPDLHRLNLSDASIATVSGFSMSHSLEFELHDASRLTLDDIMAGNTSLSLSDASEVSGSIEMDDGEFRLNDSSTLTLEGAAEDIKLDGASSSEADLADFHVVTADVELSASSVAVINVSARMDVNLSSSSSLEYIGSPKLGNLNMSGDSKLSQKQ